MTNKFYKETANLSVYVVNLAEYNKCNLVEDYTNCNPTEGWVSLPISKDEWEDFLKTIGNPEKYAIHDYEDNLGLNGIEITQYMSLKELNELGERMGNIDPSEVDAFNALYEALGDFKEALECFESEDYVFYGNMTMEEIAKEYIEECCDIPTYLRNHIDYKSIASDMRYYSYYETEYGIIYLE